MECDWKKKIGKGVTLKCLKTYHQDCLQFKITEGQEDWHCVRHFCLICGEKKLKYMCKYCSISICSNCPESMVNKYGNPNYSEVETPNTREYMDSIQVIVCQQCLELVDKCIDRKMIDAEYKNQFIIKKFPGLVGNCTSVYIVDKSLKPKLSENVNNKSSNQLVENNNSLTPLLDESSITITLPVVIDTVQYQENLPVTINADNSSIINDPNMKLANIESDVINVENIDSSIINDTNMTLANIESDVINVDNVINDNMKFANIESDFINIENIDSNTITTDMMVTNHTTNFVHESLLSAVDIESNAVTNIEANTDRVRVRLALNCKSGEKRTRTETNTDAEDDTETVSLDALLSLRDYLDCI